ncbi:ParB/RepB/Spo0J family partition protein [Streptomyces genisteinicus]|uniref:ParB/RepB/Spo0J family partition protein n=1 Tax=Streptomyces genisteinicus TaxID=2768068 RepID=A0A7H0I5B3_9ACTN|nr:ParB/RepB/Spo0J family partition protein [Streptomyces genisteinicus]QNP67979.1 ParB/RepB/Spo0J family partition protein [Streptomyces genisteinicus]
MSIADKVGASSSFGRTRQRSERGRAKAIAEGAIPSYELVRLELAQVSPTPLNPRRNFGADEDMSRFGEELRQVQLAACVAVTRSAYLALWPAHEDAIGEACQYVLINGERRFRSALHVGIEQLDFVVRDDLASSREDFVDHLLAENLDREDFDVLERARGVQQLVDVCAEDGGERGARSRAAQRLGKDRSWVTNQLALLTLPEEIQVLLSTGEVSERDGRVLARRLKDDASLTPEMLMSLLNSAKDAAEEQKAETERLLAAGREALAQVGSAGLLSADNKPAESEGAISSSGVGEGDSGDLLSADNVSAVEAGPSADVAAEAPSPTPGRSGLLSADNKPAASVAVVEANGSASPGRSEPPAPGGQAADGVPVPREEGAAADSVRPVVTGVRFPYDNAMRAAEFLNARMDDVQFLALVDRLNELAGSRRGSVGAPAE